MKEPEREIAPGYAELRTSIGRLEWRDWELWSIALLLLVVFAGGFLTYIYSQIAEERALSPAAARFLWLVLFGLLVLVVLLNIYLIDRKRTLAQLWRRYLRQMDELGQEREQAMRDPLTQVYNRRFFDETVTKEARRCDRAGRPLSFLLVDVDNFKQVNERLGHFEGDKVLQAVAAVLQDTLRTSDLVFRFGGDEFLVVLPETPAEGAAIVEARLQQRLSQRQDIQERIGRPLTVTIGRGTYGKGDKVEAVIEQAERSLDRGRVQKQP